MSGCDLLFWAFCTNYLVSAIGEQMGFKINAVKTLMLELAFLIWIVLLSTTTFAQTKVQTASSSIESQSEVISAFTASEINQKEQDSETKFRRQFIFAMGVILLIFIFSTAYFGLSMALFDKQVFVPHMICAGVTVFLALAHAVVAIVWFFPF